MQLWEDTSSSDQAFLKLDVYEDTSSTCTPPSEEEISDLSCFDDDEYESSNATQKSSTKNPRQGCCTRNFEHYMASRVIDILKSSLPGTPKNVSGRCPRIASTRPRSASSVGSTRPRSASSAQSFTQSAERPMSASSVLQTLKLGSQPRRRNRPASATLESLSKSFRRSKSTTKISPQSPKRHAQQSEPHVRRLWASRQFVELKSLQSAKGKQVATDMSLKSPATCRSELKGKPLPLAVGNNQICSGEWRSLALPMW